MGGKNGVNTWAMNGAKNGFPGWAFRNGLIPLMGNGEALESDSLRLAKKAHLASHMAQLGNHWVFGSQKTFIGLLGKFTGVRNFYSHTGEERAWVLPIKGAQWGIP